jgi:hypothetical protein
VLSAVARFGAAFLSLRIIEPNARSVGSLGALREMVSWRPRPEKEPALAGPHSANASGR